jgi:hypothetical protein
MLFEDQQPIPKNIRKIRRSDKDTNTIGASILISILILIIFKFIIYFMV